jgi:hypothetical protein
MSRHGKENKMTRLNMKKVEERLNQVQARCSARTMDLEDVKAFVEELQKARERALADKVERKYLKRIEGVKKYAVPNSYDWRAETTCIEGYITKYGRIKIEVYRTNAPKIPYGGTVRKIQAIFE